MLLQRALALATVAMLAAVGALALVEQRRDDPPARVLPPSVPTPDGGWYEGSAAPRLVERRGRRTSCGYVLRPGTVGIAHPVLGCGTKLYLAFGSREVLTQVISRRTPSGVQFALTPQLTKLLGLQSTDIVRWRFAAG